MGVQLSVRLICDRCRTEAGGVLVADRLRPSVGMHLRLPEGWSATTMADSGELYVLCAGCPPESTSLAPPPLHPVEEENDPTLPPPPPNWPK